MNNIEEEEEDEEDEEAKDFLIRILSRESQTVLTPVPNPYKRVDKIKEANAQLLEEDQYQQKPHHMFKIRFNNQVEYNRYVKEEEGLSDESIETSPSKLDSNKENIINRISQNTPKIVSKSSKSNTKNNHDNNNPFNNKLDSENTRTNKEMNEDENKNDISAIRILNPFENQDDNINSDLVIEEIESEHNNTILEENLQEKINNKYNKNNNVIQMNNELNKDSDSIDTNNQYEENNENGNLNEVSRNCINNNENLKYMDKLVNSSDWDHLETNSDQNSNTNNTSRKQPNTNGKIKSNHVKLKTNEVNGDLNYRPNSSERKIKDNTKHVNGNNNKIKFREMKSQSGKLIKSNKNTDEVETNLIENTENMSDTNRSRTQNETYKNYETNSNENFEKIINIKPRIQNETHKNKLKKDGASNMNNKDNTKNLIKLKNENIITNEKDTVIHNNIDKSPKLDSEYKMKIENSPKQTIQNPYTTERVIENNQTRIENNNIKEINRSKLVVLVPPFEQYKSYMNDNYDDDTTDDEESLDLNEFLKNETLSDQIYTPDFEIDSDHDEIENKNILLDSSEQCLNELENKLSNTKISNGHHDDLIVVNSSTGKKSKFNIEKKSKNKKGTSENSELKHHRYKMINNIKHNQHYENTLKKFNDEEEEEHYNLRGGTCTEKCSERPSTAPAGAANLNRKYGCLCKWSRMKLPEYNGLRSEYGLSEEQLNERKRQKHEIARRIRERKQRKIDEEQRKKMQNEKMFHEWLLKKKQQAKEQFLRNQRLRSMRYRQCITPNQKTSKQSRNNNNNNNTLAIRKKLHPGRNCFSLDEIINDVNINPEDSKTYKIYLGLSIE